MIINLSEFKGRKYVRYLVTAATDWIHEEAQKRACVEMKL